MKEKLIDLVEQQSNFTLSLTHRENNEYYYKNLCGILKRRFDGNWTSRATELSALSEAKTHITQKVKASTIKPATENTLFNPGKIRRDHQSLIDFLDRQDLETWKTIFRRNHTQKYLIKNDKLKKSTFHYSSILVKMKLPGDRQFIELGEGHTQEDFKFNLDGLKSRIKEILINQRECKPLQFNGPVPVILNAGEGGIFFHEILGHSLEADHVAQKLSPITMDQIGKAIVSDSINLVTRDKRDDFFWFHIMR